MALGKDKNAVPMNANIPAAIAIDFGVAMARRQMKKQDAMAEAMRLWANQPFGDTPKENVVNNVTHVVKSPDITIREPHISWVRLLINILDSLHPVIVPAIQQNLKAFALILGSQGGHGERGSSSPPKPGGPMPTPEDTLGKGRRVLGATDRALGRAPRSRGTKKADSA